MAMNTDAGEPCADCSVEELKAKRERGDDFVLLDVRTDAEVEMVRLKPCLHIPLHRLDGEITRLEEVHDKEIIVICHHGGRSAMAQAFLKGKGFPRVRNLTGGIHAYAMFADSSLPMYE